MREKPQVGDVWLTRGGRVALVTGSRGSVASAEYSLGLCIDVQIQGRWGRTLLTSDGYYYGAHKPNSEDLVRRLSPPPGDPT